MATVEETDGTEHESSEGLAPQADRPIAVALSPDSHSADRRLLLIIAWALVILCLIGVMGILYFARAVFFPIALAVILKLVFSPVVRRIHRWGLPNALAAALIVGGAFAISLVAVVFLSAPAARWIDDAPQYLRTAEYKLRSFKKPIEKIGQAGEKVDELAAVSAEKEPVSVEVKQPGLSSAILNTTSEIAVGGFLTVVLLFFLLASGDSLLEKMLDFVPLWRDKRKLVCLVAEIQQSMSSYLFATTVINTFLGLVIGIGMWLVGLPNPVLWGVMAACLNFIPYFGCILGGGIVFLVGVTSLDSTAHALWAPLVYFTVNSIEGYFITPSVVGRSISLSPLMIVVSMIVWGWLWGVGGLLLAVPILAALKIACDHVESLKPVGHLLGQ